MNHVHRVVFNAVTGVWQAVSEIARGPGKSSRCAKRARRKGLNTLAASTIFLTSSLASASAFAACSPLSPVNGDSVLCSGTILNYAWTGDDLNYNILSGSLASSTSQGTPAFHVTGTGTTVINSSVIDPIWGQSFTTPTTALKLESPTSSVLRVTNSDFLSHIRGGSGNFGSSLSSMAGMAIEISNGAGGQTFITNHGTISSNPLVGSSEVDADRPVVAVYGGGEVTMTNIGTITGRVAFEASAGGNSFFNVDNIEGSVSLGAGSTNRFYAITGSSVSKGAGTAGTLTNTAGINLEFAPTGIVDGGAGGQNTLYLRNDLAGGSGTTSTGTVSTANYINFSNLIVDSGTWNVSGALLTGGTTSTTLNGGLLRAGNGSFAGTGTITSNGGELSAASASLTLANNIVLGVNAGQGTNGLTVSGANAITLNGEISGGSSSVLVKNGSGVLQLNGANLYSGGTVLNAGTTTVGNNSAFGSGAVTIGSGGASVDANTAVTLANNFNLLGNVIFGGSNSLTVAGNVLGNAGTALGKTGSSDLVLTGSNTYGGGTVLSAGTLSVGNNLALGTGTLSVTGGSTLSSTQAVTLANNIALSNNLTVSGANDIRLNGQITGTSGKLFKSGSGNLTLGNTNNLFSGGISLNGGTLTLVTPSGSLGSGSITAIGDSRLTVGVVQVFSTPIAINSGVALEFFNDSAVFQTGVISGSGTFAKSGSDELSLLMSNTFTGLVDVRQGTLTALTTNALGVNPDLAVASGATVNLGSDTALNGLSGAGSVSNGTALSVGNGNRSSLFGGVLSSSGTLAKNGTGTLTLTGANTLTGNTTLNGGLLTVASGASLASNLVTVNSGATLGGAGTLNGAVTVGSGGHLGLTSGQTLSTGTLTLNSGSFLDLALGAPTLRPMANVTGNVNLNNTVFNITDLGDLNNGSYRLFNFSGTVTDNGLSPGLLPADISPGNLAFSYSFTNKTVTLIVNSPNLGVQFWDGNNSVANGSVNGGSGVWGSAATNWTKSTGNTNLAWAGAGAVFQGSAGVVLVQEPQSVSGLQFKTDGYVLAQGANGALNLVNGIGNTATVTTDNGVTAQIAAPIIGTGKLTKASAGTLVLSGDNTYSGGTAVTGGTLVVRNDNALGTGSLTLSSGTTFNTDTFMASLTNGMVVNGAATVKVDNSRLTLGGAISGAGGLIKTGTGSLVLNGNNNMLGNFNLTAGSLIIGNGSVLGAGRLVTASGTTLDAGVSGIGITNNVVMSGDLTLQGSHDMSLSGTLSGTGNLIKNGGNALDLTGPSTLNGTVTINGGTLRLGEATSLGNTALNVNSASTLESSADISVGNSASLNAALTVIGSKALALTGALTGTGELIKNGSGTLTLAGNNQALSGNTQLNQGTLKLGHANALGTGNLTVAGTASLDSSSALTVANNVDISGALTVLGTQPLGLSGVVSGNGSLTKSGSSTLTLSGANTFSGTYLVNDGRLISTSASGLGAPSQVTVAAAGTMQLNNGGSVARLYGSGNVAIDGGDFTVAAGAFTGTLSGLGNLVKTGTGTLQLSGNNNLVGATKINDGVLLVDGNLGTGSVSVANGAVLGGTGSLGGAVSVADGGHLDLASGFQLSLGSLVLNNDSNIDAALGAAIPSAGGLVGVTGDLTLDGKLNVSNAGGFGLGVYRLFDYGGQLTDNGLILGVLPSGVQAGDLALQTSVGKQVNLVVGGTSNVRFWDGAGNVDDGAIAGGSGIWNSSNSSWTIGSGGFNQAWNDKFAVFQGTAGAVEVQGTQRTIGMQFATDGYRLMADPSGVGGQLELVNDSTGYTSIRVGSNSTATLDVSLSGNGTLNKQETGTLVLNAANSYTGGTLLNGGKIVVGNNAALGTGVLTAANGTVLDSNAAVTLANNVELKGALNVAGSNALTLGGTVSGAGSLLKTGASSLTLNGNNSYSGGTILEGGSAVLGHNSALGSGSLTVNSAATLDSNQALTIANQVVLNAGLTVAGSHDLTLEGNISGAGGMTKNGSSTLTLNGANTYTGGTNVNAGTLALGAGASLTSNGILNLANNATLDLSAGDGTQTFGTLVGNGTLKMGTNILTAGGSADGVFSGSMTGTGSFVKQGTGTETFTGTNLYTGGTLVAAGTLQAGSANAFVQNTAYQVQSGATLDLNNHALQASSLTGAGTVALGTADLTVNTATGTVSSFAGQTQGSGNLIKQGEGTLVLNGASTLTGNVELKQGRINLGNALGLGSGTLAMDDGTTIGLTANGMTIVNNLYMTGANDPVVDTGTNNAIWAGAITGAGFLTKQGTGTLTMTSTANTYTGATDVAQGTLQAGAANTFSSTSAHTVATGAVLDLAGYNQTLASLNNSGTVNLSGATPGTVLKVTGAYVGNNGNLGLSTTLGADGSVTDKLLLSGTAAVASGNTTVHITNAGGLGAQTTGNGIEIIGTENGASLLPGSFTLAGGHVDAGAYEYRLTRTEQSAALHSTNPQDPTNPGTPTTPITPATAYRSEVPLLSALPAQLRQADMAMLGDLRKRMGDEGTQATTSTDAGASRRVWGRVLRTDPKISQQGTVSPESSGHLTGFQAGLDLFADKNLKAGIYVGQLEGDMSVKGFASGIQRNYVGFNNLRTRYLGVYGTWQDESGLYADAVLQGADYRSDLRTAGDTAQARTKGSGWLASLEMGKPLALSSNWQIEPQAQIIYRKLNIDDTALSLATVKNKADDDWTVRLGARIKGNFTTGAGVLQPYGRINVYKASNTTDIASFAAPGGSTDIQAKGGYTATEMAAGASLQINQRTSIYGELGKLWANGGDSRVKSGVQASIGVKVQW